MVKPYQTLFYYLSKLINFFSERKQKRSVGIYMYTFFLLLGSFWGINGVAQTFPATTSCTSGDLELIEAVLPAPDNDPCACGGTRYLVLSIKNKTGSTRTSFAFWGYLEIRNADGSLDQLKSGPIQDCFGEIKANDVTPKTYSKPITFTCGQTVRITNLFLAWTDANKKSICPLNSATIAPKCGTLPSIRVLAGVDADIATSPATCTLDGSVTVSPYGGQAPYTVTIGNETKTVEENQSATFNRPAGSYSVSILDSRTPTKCAAPARTAEVASSQAPASPTNAADQIVCYNGSSSQTLTASATPANGTSLLWYTAATGGTGSSTAPTQVGIGSKTVYAASRNTTTNCESNRVAVKLEIKAVPDAPTANGGSECQASPIQTLTASATAPEGGSIKWYTVATNGTGITTAPSRNTVGSSTHYAEAIGANGCASLTRSPVTLEIKAAPNAPTSGGNQSECALSPLQTLTATATPPNGTVVWYSANTGGNTVAEPKLNSIGSVTYYAATAGSNGCSSLSRTAVTLELKASPNAPEANGASACQQNPIQTLSATATAPAGGSILWYSTATGGSGSSNTPTHNTVGVSTHYAEAVGSNGCKSLARTQVVLEIKALPGAPVLVVTQPSLCGPATGTLEVCSPTTGYKYSIGSTEITAKENQPVKFDNLAPGSNPGVKVLGANGCEATTACTSALPTCPTVGTKAITGTNESGSNQTAKTIDIKARIGGATKVLAAPNPFTDKVRFTLQSEVSGQGSLEIYNTVGQKIATIYQGYVEAGKPLVKEYQVPMSHRANLVYEFRVGDQKTTGKLLNW